MIIIIVVVVTPLYNITIRESLLVVLSVEDSMHAYKLDMQLS